MVTVLKDEVTQPLVPPKHHFKTAQDATEVRKLRGFLIFS